MKNSVKPAAVFVIAILCGSAVLGAQNNSAGPSAHPNILLIIGDDIGMDVTTDMYPGLVDALVRQYGPQGLNHPNYKTIQGHPASTPVLDELASQGMSFSN